MRGKWTRMVLLVLVFGLAACGGSASSTEVSCSGSFKANTDLGIGEGLKLLGSLNFQVDTSGGLSGSFIGTGQPAIQVVGQVAGRSVNLAADLGGGQYLFGSGTIQSSANGCPTIAGGPLAVESAPASAAGPAKLLVPARQALVERTGTWFYKAK